MRDAAWMRRVWRRGVMLGVWVLRWKTKGMWNGMKGLLGACRCAWLRLGERV